MNILDILHTLEGTLHTYIHVVHCTIISCVYYCTTFVMLRQVVQFYVLRFHLRSDLFIYLCNSFTNQCVAIDFSSVSTLTCIGMLQGTTHDCTYDND